ncbi:helix-turn-helix transcriptional regulator [Paenibacillus hodogayensis]|uniref:Helix-turn-helix transcriptional regulator n=1 Tax=Paenibacillus hodogayensis TaxID=279208 RepID=A0ABV5VPG3_9BACL
MHRILWFDEQIRASRFPNAKALAEHFEISVRQAGRDIEYMQDSLHAPMSYNAKRRGYAYNDAAYILPSVFLTETDIRIVNFLIYKYEEAVKSIGYVEGLDRVVQTLKRFVPYQPEDSELPAFIVDSRTAQHKHDIDRAIERGHKLCIVYADNAGEHEVDIHPYRTYSQTAPAHVTVIAWCEQSGEVEYFRLDRIESIRCSGQSYLR